MLNSIFLILFFQLVGEFIQKFLEISIPGPVIGLLLSSITIYSCWGRGCYALVLTRR